MSLSTSNFHFRFSVHFSVQKSANSTKHRVWSVISLSLDSIIHSLFSDIRTCRRSEHSSRSIAESIRCNRIRTAMAFRSCRLSAYHSGNQHFCVSRFNFDCNDIVLRRSSIRTSTMCRNDDVRNSRRCSRRFDAKIESISIENTLHSALDDYRFGGRMSRFGSRSSTKGSFPICRLSWFLFFQHMGSDGAITWTPTQFVFPISSVQLFVYMLIPLISAIDDDDISSNIRLESGKRIWHALWHARQPDVFCFSAPVKPRKTQLSLFMPIVRQNIDELTTAQGIYVGE